MQQLQITQCCNMSAQRLAITDGSQTSMFSASTGSRAKQLRHIHAARYPGCLIGAALSAAIVSLMRNAPLGATPPLICGLSAIKNKILLLNRGSFFESKVYILYLETPSSDTS